MSIDKVLPTQHFIHKEGTLFYLRYLGVLKKFLKGRCLLYFEFINKVLLS